MLNPCSLNSSKKVCHAAAVVGLVRATRSTPIAAYLPDLLRARRERPRCRRAAEQRDERATGHRMIAFANALRASRA